MKKWYYEIGVSEYLAVMRLDHRGIIKKENRPQLRPSSDGRGNKVRSEVVRLINSELTLSYAKVLASQGAISGNALLCFAKQRQWMEEGDTVSRAAFLKARALGQWRRNRGRMNSYRAWSDCIISG